MRLYNQVANKLSLSKTRKSSYDSLLAQKKKKKKREMVAIKLAKHTYKINIQSFVK